MPNNNNHIPLDIGPSFDEEELDLEMLPIGKVVFQKRFELVEELGQGAFGRVFKAKVLTDGRDGIDKYLALKFLPPEISHDAKAQKNLYLEADKLEKLSHDYIINFRGIEREGMHWAIAMEYAEGGSLDSALQACERGYFEPAEIEKWARQSLLGMDYLHSKDIIHRDFKPQNILLSAEGDIRIADFGLSGSLSSSLSRMSKEGDPAKKNPKKNESFKGSIPWSSPQSILGSSKPAKKDDIYGIGASLYELLTGNIPYPFANNDQLMSVQISSELSEIPPVNDRRADLYDGETGEPLSEGWQEFMAALLSHHSKDRPESGAKALEFLELQDASKVRVKEKPQKQRERKLKQREGGGNTKKAYACISLFVLAVIGVVIWQPWSGNDQNLKEKQAGNLERNAEPPTATELKIESERQAEELKQLELAKRKAIFNQPIRGIDAIFQGSVYEKWDEASRKAIIEEVQLKLKNKGFYYSKDLDEYAGKETHYAVLRYQLEKADLTATGYLDDATLSSLEMPEYNENEGIVAGQEKEYEIFPGEKVAFRWIPATGEKGFLMGSPEGESEYKDETQHKVILSKGYWMAETETTQGQWEAVMGSNPSYFKNAGKNAPVETVSYKDIEEFITKVNDSGKLLEGMEARLPTEAEWEYACRAGTGTIFNTGSHRILGARNSPGLGEIAWYGGNSGVTYAGGYDSSGWTEKELAHKSAGTHEVGKKEANGWGLYDMHGNVWEWCSDWYGEYKGGTERDPKGATSGNNRVLRGGSWFNDAEDCRSANRFGDYPSYRNSRYGFRLVIQVPEN